MTLADKYTWEPEYIVIRKKVEKDASEFASEIVDEWIDSSVISILDVTSALPTVLESARTVVEDHLIEVLKTWVTDTTDRTRESLRQALILAARGELPGMEPIFGEPEEEEPEEGEEPEEDEELPTINPPVSPLPEPPSPQVIYESVLRAMEPSFSSQRAEVIAITETTRFFGAGAMASYTALGLENWEWSTVRDPWVCFPRNTMIAVDDGSVPIQDVIVPVMSHLGIRPVVSERMTLYRGSFVLLRHEWGDLLCTSDHPIYVDGLWIAACDVSVGDRLKTCQNESSLVVATVEFVLFKTNQIESSIGEVGSLSKVSGGISMPIGAVDFQDGSVDQEVNTISSNSGFLLELDSKILKDLANRTLQVVLSSKPSVTGQRAESSFATRTFSKASFTSRAGIGSYRTSALLRAMDSFGTSVDFPFAGDDLPACLAVDNRIISRFALDTTECESVVNTSPDSKFFVTSRTPFDNAFTCIPARKATEFPLPFICKLDDFVTGLTVGRDNSSGAQVIALPRAVNGSLVSLPRDLAITLSAMSRAGHRSLVYHGRCFTSIDVPVYNLHVEEAETFYADGILVHNCSVCEPRNGQIYPLAEPFEPAHPRCRCFSRPVATPGLAIPRAASVVKHLKAAVEEDDVVIIKKKGKPDTRPTK